MRNLIVDSFSPLHPPLLSQVSRFPTATYEPVDELVGDGKELARVFKNVRCRIEAEEAEQVGVEHLLRDINDPSASQLSFQIKLKLQGLVGLMERLKEMGQYLQHVLAGRLPVNHQIIGNLQTVFNLLPNLSVPELVKAMLAQANDAYLAIYVASLARSVIALHDLLLNKIRYRGIADGALLGAAPAPPADDKKTGADKKTEDKTSEGDK